MPFNKYIFDLLLDNEVVIIPEFGAFVTSVIPSRTDIVTGDLLPPSKVIRFDPKIRNNDWLLANYVAEKEGLNEHDALKRIRKICDEILYRLDNGETVSFERTGLLYFDSNKELCFDQDNESAFHPDSYGFEPLKAAVSKEETHVPATENSIESKEPKLMVDWPGTSSSWERPPTKINYRWLYIFIPIFLCFFIVYRVWLKPVKNTVQVIVQPVDKNMSIDSFPVKDTLPKEKIVQKDSVTKSDTVKIEKTIGDQDTIQGKKYYVIGGSFENEDNARQYVAKMESKGFHPFIMKKKGRFFIVAVGVFADMTQAADLKRHIEEEVRSTDIWILPE